MNDLTVSDWILYAFAYFGMQLNVSDWLYKFTSLLLLFFFGWLMFRLARYIFQGKLTRLIIASNNTWDDELHKHNFFRRGCHVIPAITVYLCSNLLFESNPILLNIVQKSMIIYVLLASVWAGSALLNTIQDVYNTSHLAQRAPITGFIQVTKLLLVIIAALLIIANLLDKSPLLLLSGLGAVTAILLLLFRDTILGFVAGIQIAANRMVNTGDWIQMDQFGADGDVLEVGLTTVKVQNWDKTISTIPTYALITESMKNWRGMTESGGRRIKRAIKIDIQSVTFLDMEDIEAFRKIRFIADYIDKKLEELKAFHQQQEIDEHDLVNSRRMTNVGTLRAYMEAYLRNHPKLNKELTLMVRQLPPTEFGLPLEIYCFSEIKDWVQYEKIQADIFDHMIAMLPVFKLRAYQRVSDNPH